jgi:hypothetical protein
MTADDDILQALGLGPSNAPQISSRLHAASGDAEVHAAAAGPQSHAAVHPAGFPISHAAPSSSSPPDNTGLSPAKQQVLLRPALAAMRPCSLSSLDMSDVEESGDQAAFRPAAGACAPTVQMWQPQAPLHAPALTDSSNQQAHDAPLRPPILPPPNRKVAPAVRPQQAAAFAAPRMQAPQPGAHPEAGSTAGLAAARASLVPNGAAVGLPQKHLVAQPVSQPGVIEFPTPGQERRRNVTVPDSFQSLQQYKRTWTAALIEEAGLRSV